MQPPSVPLRVAHFDAKADNFLIDADGQVSALIDLDTVMPGSILWDVGDLLRSATATQPEDVPDGMAFDAARAGAILSAYRDAAGDLLTEAERSALPLAGPVVTFEQAVRFLADHLAGDAYYRVGYRGHNLDRARAQLLLLEGMVEMVR
jgi:Ser/Thr protein kinase RdoA (MazF antagonist)